MLIKRLQDIKLTILNRGMKTLKFGETVEQVWERSDYPIPKVQKTLSGKKVGILGYGPQGRGQSLNLKDNGIQVKIGIRKGPSYDKAIQDGWDKNDLMDIEKTCKQSDIIINLLSDAAQTQMWPIVKPHLTEGKTLCFSHGFSIVYKELTKVIPNDNIDVIMVAPKGSGMTVRTLFKEGKGINSSFAIHQDYTGKAQDTALAIGVGIGSGYLYPTTFKKEVYSDLTGERGVLMGGIYGMFLAQYQVLREKGHSPSEAFNETVEEATQSLYPLIGQNGMEWMYANCSTTAQRGALDWYPKFRDATKPIFEQIYKEVENGNEAKRSLDKNSQNNYRQDLEKELNDIRNNEMGRAGKVVRDLRPENQKS